jgi:hypothetical protein
LEDAVKEVSKFGLEMNLAAVLFSRLQTPEWDFCAVLLFGKKN